MLGFIAAGAVLLLVLVLVLRGLFSSADESRATEHYERATLYYMEQDYDRAIAELELAIDYNPNGSSYYTMLATIYVERGQVEKAINLLTARYGNSPPEAVALKLAQYQTLLDAGTDDSISIGGESVAPGETTLILARKNLTSAELLPLAGLSQLESLTLTDNSIADLTNLAPLVGLSFLHLGNNLVTNLAPLANLTELKTLYLDGNTGITDLTPLAGLTKLRTLSLQGIAIGSNRLEALEAALPQCDIFCDEVVQEAKELTLGGLDFRSDVTALDLSNRNITDISVLAECTALTTLDLSKNNIVDLTPLAGLKELTWLKLPENKVTDVAPLLTLPALLYLDLDENDIRDFTVLGELRTLEELWLSGNAPQSLAPLKTLTKLTRLGLDDVGLTDADMTLLSSLKSLRELTIRDNEPLTASGVEKFMVAVPNCTVRHSDLFYTLTLGSRTFLSNVKTISAVGVSITSLKGIEHFRLLTSLTLSNNRIYDVGPLSTLTALETLELAENAIVTIDALAGLTGLTRLDLRDNAIANLGPLSNLKALRFLDLEDNDISDLSPLMGLTNLETLFLSHNESLAAEQIVALQERIPNCVIHTNLDLTPPPSPEPTPEITEPPTERDAPPR